MRRVSHLQLSVNLFFKCHYLSYFIDQNTLFGSFAWKSLSQSPALNRTSIEKWKKNTFWGYLIITAVSVLNLLKKQQFLTCYSLLQFIILKISINTCVECKISIRTISTIFFPVRVPVWRLTKSGDLYLSFFKIYFLVLNRLKKPKRSEQDKVIY